MDATKLGFDKETFDSALIIGFFHHLDKETMLKVVKEVKRVLKKQGKILLIEDHPTRSRWNVIGRWLQKYDEGAFIRPAKVYKEILEEELSVEKIYPMRSGFWDYTVFVMRKR